MVSGRQISLQYPGTSCGLLISIKNSTFLADFCLNACQPHFVSPSPVNCFAFPISFVSLIYKSFSLSRLTLFSSRGSTVSFPNVLTTTGTSSANRSLRAMIREAVILIRKPLRSQTFFVSFPSWLLLPLFYYLPHCSSYFFKAWKKHRIC